MSYLNRHSSGFYYELYQLRDGPTPLTLQEWVEHVELPLSSLLDLFAATLEEGPTTLSWKARAPHYIDQHLNSMVYRNWIDNPDAECNYYVERDCVKARADAEAVIMFNVSGTRYSITMTTREPAI